MNKKKANPPIKKEIRIAKTKRIVSNYKNNEQKETNNDVSNRYLNNNLNTILKQRKNYEFCKRVLEFNDFELNEMTYQNAIKNDRRTYISYYYFYN